ncbi:MAG: protein phosphatase 2C domain-containing protein [Bryobacteraceae bacterium]|jgi:protein phosphatase
MRLLSHGVSDIGCVRSENQDRILFDDALGLYVVCDGVGGRRRGDLAAEIAIQTIREFVESSTDPMEVTWPYGYNQRVSFASNRIFTAVKLANRQVWRRAEDSLQCLGMGATVAAVLVDGSLAVVANIGDSRVYLLRGPAFEQLSVDDTASMYLPNSSGRTEVERSVLTRAAGSEQNVDVHLKETEVAAGDLLLLCSDGLHGSLPKEQIAAIVAASHPTAAQAEALIAAARSGGAPDNVSVVLLQFQ